ncbi:MAG: NDP-sugar synthase [Actinomycetota bacterium]|nr:NDP-sugar synthase [Actinomycetota bacterium]
MKAVVLVGGEGTRLRPLTLTTPKQMLPIVEVPMIERVLSHLAAHGVEEATLSLGYRPDPFLSLFPSDRVGDMVLRYAVEPEPRGTAGAIRFAAEAAGIDDTFLAVNGDVLTDLDLTALIDFHRRWDAEGTIALTHVEDPSAFGLVPTGADGRVLAFVEKPLPEESVTGAINAGTYVLEPSVLDRIPKDEAVSIERQVFPPMASEGRLFAAASEAYWIDTGTPAQYLQAQLDLLDGRRPPPPAPGARLRGGGSVWVLDEAVIDGLVEGPALIGAAAYIQAGAKVERSVIGSGARVSKGAEVRDSVLLPGAAVHAGAVVDQSIVGDGSVVGERARLSGLTVIGAGIEVEPGARLFQVRLPVGG